MRNLKKVLSLVVALTFVLSTVAFATPTSDIEDENVKEAVERLAAFGIVSGKDDGLYHPEENLTREQFAKLVVEAMGLGPAAEASGGDTGFSDVASNRWSAGYIQVASGKGIIKGKGDGTFDPEAGVTYPEAVTMLVRALGYKDEFLVGAWPSNYVAKAAELDIPLGANYSVNGVVDRGAAAVLVNNTLDAKVIEQETYGDDNNWEVSDNTLLESKLDVKKLEDSTVTATAFVNDGLDADEITVDCQDEDYENTKYEGSDDYTLLSGSANGLLFLEGIMYLNDDDEIVYFDVTTDEDDIITGWITNPAKDGKDQIEVKFADGDKKKYDYDTTPASGEEITFYINNEESTNNGQNDAYDDFAAGQYGTVVLNDKGDIQYACVYTMDDYIVVQDVDEEEDTVKGFYMDNDDKKIDLGSEDGYKLFKNGEVIELSDLEVGNVLVVTDVVKEVDGDDYIYGYVSDAIVEGTLDSAEDDALELDGEDYDVDSRAGFSLDNGDSIEGVYNDATELEDAIDDTITAYLDIKGEIVYFETEAISVSDTMYGIVTKTNQIDDDSVKIYNANGEEITYELDDDADAYDPGFREGDIVAFTVDSDGTIDYDTTPADSQYGILAGKTFDASHDIQAADVTKQFVVSDVITDGSRVVVAGVTDFDDDNDYIKVDTDGDGTYDDRYFIDDDSNLVSYYDDDQRTIIDPAKVDWEDIESKSVPTNMNAVFVLDEDGIDIEFAVFTEGYDLSGDITVGYLTSDPSIVSGGDWEIDVVNSAGDDTTYILASDSDRSDLEKGDFVIFDLSDKGEFNNFDVLVRDNVYATGLTATFDQAGRDDYELYAGRVTESDSSTISINDVNVGSYTERIKSDTAFYELVLKNTGKYDSVDEIDSSDIRDTNDVDQNELSDFVVLVYNEDDGYLEMVIKIDYSEYEDFNANWVLNGVGAGTVKNH